MMSGQLAHRFASAANKSRGTGRPPVPKVGAEIFEGTDYPTSWDSLVGQERAVAQLRAACLSARVRQTRLDHVLLASGVPGIGKTSLAKLVAADIGTGIVEVAGKIGLDEARNILSGMSANDVLFIDEVHQMAGGTKAEWLLHVLQDGVLMTKNGPEPIPDITIVAATTDSQKLPMTILGRFPIKPVLEAYTEDEAATICEQMAERVGFGATDFIPVPGPATRVRIARAANCNPRDMRMLLIALRDATVSEATVAVGSTYDLSVALEWAGYTEDGLTRLAQDYLQVLLVTYDGQAGEKTIGCALGEPGPLKHTEQVLIQKSLLSITASGRQLTPEGVDRAIALLKEKGIA